MAAISAAGSAARAGAANSASPSDITTGFIDPSERRTSDLIARRDPRLRYGRRRMASSKTRKRAKKPAPRRSAAWFGLQDKNGFLYRSWVKNRGVPDDQFDGRPVIGICNTYSELTPCNSHFRTIAEHVKSGVLEAGGFPLEFPVMSLGESLLRPTAMLYRNLASMDV